MTSRGDVTVLETAPEIAPAVASIKALFICPASSIPHTPNNRITKLKLQPFAVNFKWAHKKVSENLKGSDEEHIQFQFVKKKGTLITIHT